MVGWVGVEEVDGHVWVTERMWGAMSAYSRKLG